MARRPVTSGPFQVPGGESVMRLRLDRRLVKNSFSLAQRTKTLTEVIPYASLLYVGTLSVRT